MEFRATAFLFLAALTVASVSFAGTAPIDEMWLRKFTNVDTSTKLYFRKADGSSISEPDFLHAVNLGQPFFAEGPAYHGKQVFFLGQSVEWGLVVPPGGRASKLEKGGPIPPFALTTLDGQHVSNAMFEGKITLIDFFAYGCSPCIDEMPALNAFKVAHPEIQTLAVAPNNDVYLRDLVQYEHFSWPTAVNAGLFFRDIELRATPTLALVDEQGRMVAMRMGSIKAEGNAHVTEGSIAQWVNSHIAAQH